MTPENPATAAADSAACLARRWCNGDQAWTRWRAIELDEYERRKADSSFQFRPLVGATALTWQEAELATMPDRADAAVEWLRPRGHLDVATDDHSEHVVMRRRPGEQ